MTEPLCLTGLDGGSPIGFLAALGTLVAAARLPGGAAARLAWTQDQGAWRPCLHAQPAPSADAFVLALDTALRTMIGHPAFTLADDLTVPLDQFHTRALQALDGATPPDRTLLDYLAAFGSEGCEARASGKPTGCIADTAFRTMSGAGHQHFLGTMRVLIEDTTAEHLRRTLFTPWDYADPLEKHSLRWDPMDDVRYALRWRDSSGDPERRRSGGMWGANRLAIEALALFPTMPAAHGLGTTGFTNHRGHGAQWTWPIWEGALGRDALRSVLALGELRSLTPDRERLRQRGVVEVYRAARFTQGKFRNLGIAAPV